MILGIQDVLTPDEVASINAQLEGIDFVDGRETAGIHARVVKNNEQAPKNDPRVDPLKKRIEGALMRNRVFAMAVRPRRLSLLFNRYGEGQTYGSHVDNAFMRDLRTDVSLTLFLADPATYEGGELVMEETSGERRIKLRAGSAVVYPSTMIHRVEPVTSGTRKACVGWVQSRVRDAAQREILYDLDVARQSLFDQYGKVREVDLVSKSLLNLLRQWGDG